MFLENRPHLEPTSPYIEVIMSHLCLDHVCTWARSRQDMGAVSEGRIFTRVEAGTRCAKNNQVGTTSFTLHQLKESQQNEQIDFVWIFTLEFVPRMSGQKLFSCGTKLRQLFMGSILSFSVPHMQNSMLIDNTNLFFGFWASERCRK